MNMSRIDSDSRLYRLSQITEPSDLEDTELWWLLKSTKLKDDVDFLVQHKLFVRVQHPEPEDEDDEFVKQDPSFMYGDAIDVPAATYSEGRLTINIETAIKDNEETLWVAGEDAVARLVLNIETPKQKE